MAPSPLYLPPAHFTAQFSCVFVKGLIFFTHLHICDPRVALPPVTVAVGGGRGRRQFIGRNAPCVPVRPVDVVCLDVQVHGIDAHVCITLEDLLVAPVWYGRIQAADLIVIGDVEHLSQS